MLPIAMIIVSQYSIQAQCSNNYLKFDGYHDWIDVSSDGPLSSIQSNISYTIEAWVKRSHTTFPNGMERIYSKDYVFQFRVVNDQFVGEIGSSLVQYPYPSDTLWHHLAFVRDVSQSTLRLFIDGILVNSVVDNSSTINNNNAMVCIGARNNGSIYEEWSGGLKLIRVSNIGRYLTSFTPSLDYASDNHTLGFWPLSEGTGNIAYDLSNNGHNGTINNAGWVAYTVPSAIISTQPNNVAININNSAHFSVASTNPSASFQWQTNGANLGWQNVFSNSNYSGVNDDTLAIYNVQFSNHNQPFRVIATSGNCIDTSNVALISILDSCVTNITVYDTLTTEVFDTTYVSETIYDTLYVTVYDTAYISVTDTLIINANLTGINPPNSLNTLRVFPNPASTNITIDYGNFNAMSGYTLTIVNSIGQTVFTTPIYQQTSYIDLSGWTGIGIYFVRLIDPQNNTIENRKIVIH